MQLIMGRNCLKEVLQAAPERLIEVCTCQKAGDALYDALSKAGIRLIDTPKKKLSHLVESDSHQNFVAKVKPRPLIEAKDFLQEEREKSLVLMLDSIFDPQNLGAILRAAVCFGVDLVIYSKNRGADITPTATKTSAGATELIPISKVSNLAETQKAFQKGGYFAIGAEISDKAQSLYDFTFPEKTLLIMGSEGKGIQPLLSKKCDGHVYIPMHGPIDSLNVSQATAVLLSYARFSR
ncbi:MAG: 23S rRNA (guanosine(2251)-2'-O)-methyltransferase RlmB [Simkaniaceae bacterium]|nr:23S rRNA (guanosine(2251)-2'-O)-methyltransferase RlmB [Candidatus Sacchlamyda saccharinae]